MKTRAMFPLVALVIALLLLTPLFQGAASAAPDIPWRKLTWDDFKGPAPDPLPSDGDVTIKAESVVGLSVSVWECPGGPLPTVQAIFDGGQSWVAANAQTAELLAHEQGHFDIAEIHARDLRQAIKNLADDLANAKNQDDCDKLTKKIKDLHEKHEKQESDEQDKYEKETAHGSDADAQAKWQAKIAKDLGK